MYTYTPAKGIFHGPITYLLLKMYTYTPAKGIFHGPITYLLLKMYTYTPANRIFHGPITYRLLILCIFIKILSHACAKRKKYGTDFQFGTFVGRFQIDSAACMAVKGLNGIRSCSERVKWDKVLQ